MKAGNYTSVSSDQVVNGGSPNERTSEKAPQSLEEHMQNVFSSTAFFEDTMRIARELQETVASFDFQEEAKRTAEEVASTFSHPFVARGKIRLCTPMMSATGPEQAPDQDHEGERVDVGVEESIHESECASPSGSLEAEECIVVDSVNPNAVAASLAMLAALQPEGALAKGGEFGIFEGRIVSLAHPFVMALVYG